jgi:hypothetical protein
MGTMTDVDLVHQLVGREVVAFAHGVHAKGLLVGYQPPYSEKNHRPSVLALKTDAGYVLVRSWFVLILRGRR